MQIDHNNENGFTLIEVIVALVLLMIATGLLGTLLVNGLTSHTKSSKTNKAVSETQNAAVTLQNDLKSAFSSDRDSANIPDLDLLRNGVLKGAIIPDPVTAGRNLDVRDIVKAYPNELEFRSDVNGDGTVMCVRYYQRILMTGERQLVRSIYNNVWGVYGVAQSCEGALVSTEVLLTIADPKLSKVT